MPVVIGGATVEPYYFYREDYDKLSALEVTWHARLSSFFAPTHCIDRRIRPRLWEP